MSQVVKDTILQMNAFGKKGQAFFFLIDYLKTKAEIHIPETLLESKIWVDFPNFCNRRQKLKTPVFNFFKSPKPFNEYQQGFEKVMKAILHGDSYLTNLTYPTPIETNLSIEAIYDHSHAKYKLKFKDQFVLFSPEPFISIEGNTIRSFPMKGTIDAGIPDAANKLMNNAKEIAEHNTIVDLIRNDLSMVAKKVRVEKFRYLEKIQTHARELLQTSSVISGKLPENWLENIGDLLFTLLPAGSISGAPKKRTLEIIEEAEGFSRGWFSGICGYFDGKNLDSAVMIRFIENQHGKLVFKSGGGITSFSEVTDEFREMADKVYVPIIKENQKDEPVLFETLRIENRTIYYPEYHNRRMNESREDLFGIHEPIDLEKEIKLPESLTDGIYKCRVTYSQKITQIEIEPYHRPAIKSLKCITADKLEYDRKFANRSEIAALYAQRDNSDDILIIKDGLVTDTSFANIIFWDGQQWLTPDKPLLTGTTRARLLAEGKIKATSMKAAHFKLFSRARIINALNDLEESADILIGEIK